MHFCQVDVFFVFCSGWKFTILYFGVTPHMVSPGAARTYLATPLLLGIRGVSTLEVASISLQNSYYYLTISVPNIMKLPCFCKCIDIVVLFNAALYVIGMATKSCSIKSFWKLQVIFLIHSKILRVLKVQLQGTWLGEPITMSREPQAIWQWWLATAHSSSCMVW